MTRNPVLVLSRYDCRVLVRLLESLGIVCTVEEHHKRANYDRQGADVLWEIHRASRLLLRCCETECEGHEVD